MRLARIQLPLAVVRRTARFFTRHVTAGGLHEALRRVRHAMCREETRYYLDGVYLHHVARVGALRFVATDGHRLATADIGTAEGAETIRPVILSRPFVVEALIRAGAVDVDA